MLEILMYKSRIRNKLSPFGPLFKKCFGVAMYINHLTRQYLEMQPFKIKLQVLKENIPPPPKENI